jgi:hypothetical protein
MKTIAELKRRLTPGTRLMNLTDGVPTDIHGNTGDTRLASNLVAGEVRTVALVQARGVTLRRPEGGTSFFEYPRSSEIEFLDEDTFRITWSEGNTMTYRIVEDAA